MIGHKETLTIDEADKKAKELGSVSFKDHKSFTYPGEWMRRYYSPDGVEVAYYLANLATFTAL